MSVADNLASMDLASASIETLEITQAVRDSTVDGQAVSEGQFMAILDGSLVALSDNPDAAAEQGIAHSSVDEDSIVTIYRGEGVDEAQAALACRKPWRQRTRTPKSTCTPAANPTIPTWYPSSNRKFPLP